MLQKHQIYICICTYISLLMLNIDCIVIEIYLSILWLPIATTFLLCRERSCSSAEPAEPARPGLQPVATERKQKTERFLLDWTAGASSGATPVLRQLHCNLHQGQPGLGDCSRQLALSSSLLITVGALARLEKELFWSSHVPANDWELHSTFCLDFRRNPLNY